MSNLVFGNPFGAALEGKRSALQDVLHTGQASRQMRDSDLNYDFNKWYQPLRQAEAQNSTAAALLKEAASVAHYSGDYSAYNGILAHYLGVPLERLPPGYAQGKGTAQQTKAADLATGLLPTPFAYPDIAGAGGAFRGLPQGMAQRGTGDPELDALMKQVTMKRLQNELTGVAPGAAGADVPHMNPLGGITPTPAQGPTLSQKVAPVWGSEGEPPPESFYGLPKTPKPQANASFSPWADEYQQAPKQESTDGAE